MATAIAMQSDPILAQYLAMPLRECREAIFALRGTVADRLLHLGKAVRAYKMNGGDVDDLGLNGMTPWLLAVGGDELYAPVVAMFIREKKLIRRLAALPFEDQKHIGDGGTVPLLVMDGATPTTLQVKLADVKDDDILDQLLGTDHIRSVAEQRIWIESRKARASLPPPDQIGPFEIDADRIVARFVGRKGDVIDLSTAEAMVAALRKARTLGK